MFDSILVVCIGNICRSPTGERLLRRYLPHKKIDSAGLGALVGNSADLMATQVAQAQGLSLAEHTAQQFSSALAMQYDLILVMEKSHLETVKRKYPEVSGKTMLFGHWLNQQEIGDPYKKSQDTYQLVYTQLAQCAELWANKLK